MSQFFCSDAFDIDNFHDISIMIEAKSADAAAEDFASETFDEGDVDPECPIEVVVAISRDAKNVTKFSVRRIVEIRHELRDMGEVEIPKDDE